MDMPDRIGFAWRNLNIDREINLDCPMNPYPYFIDKPSLRAASQFAERLFGFIDRNSGNHLHFWLWNNLLPT